MTLREFLNVAASLRFIDRPEFEACLPTENKTPNGRAYHSDWLTFQNDPVRWLSKQPDDVADRVFSLIKQEAR
jgi:hypothetical protein